MKRRSVVDDDSVAMELDRYGRLALPVDLEAKLFADLRHIHLVVATQHLHQIPDRHELHVLQQPLLQPDQSCFSDVTEVAFDQASGQVADALSLDISEEPREVFLGEERIRFGAGRGGMRIVGALSAIGEEEGGLDLG
jgi:hypothetical protein